MKTSECIGEVVGMFVFVYIALTQKEPLVIVIGLFIAIMISVSFGSKSYLNPGIVIGDYAKDKISQSDTNNMTGQDAIGYIGCELLGVVLAVLLVHLQKTYKNV